MYPRHEEQGHHEREDCGCGGHGHHEGGHERGFGHHGHHRGGDCGCGGHGHQEGGHGFGHHRHHGMGWGGMPHEGCGCPWHQPGMGGFRMGMMGMHGGMGFGFRRFVSRDEIISRFEEYLKELQSEAKAVEERIAEIKKEKAS